MGGKPSNEVPETAYEVELAKISKEKWDDYEQRFKPYENKAIADVTDLGKNELLQNKVAGQVNADIAQKNNQPTARIDPSSGEFQGPSWENAIGMGG